MDFDYLHEVEEVVLQAEGKRGFASLWEVLTEQGFTWDEDVFSLDRPKKLAMPVWQSRSFVAVHIFNDEIEVYESGGEWDKVVLKYLLATQPRSGIAIFSKQASDISARLGIPMTFKGRHVTRDELDLSLNRFADELTTHIAEPGSEDVAIVIQSTYPRRRK